MELTVGEKLNWGISILTAAEAFNHGGDMKKGTAALLADTDINRMSTSFRKEFDALSLKMKKMCTHYCASEKALLHKKALLVAEVALLNLNNIKS